MGRRLIDALPGGTFAPIVGAGLPGLIATPSSARRLRQGNASRLALIADELQERAGLPRPARFCVLGTIARLSGVTGDAMPPLPRAGGGSEPSRLGCGPIWRCARLSSFGKN